MPILSTKQMRKRKRGGRGNMFNLPERKKAFGWFHTGMPGWAVMREHQFIRFEEESDEGETNVVARTPRCCNIMDPEHPDQVLFNVCPAEALVPFISQKVKDGELEEDDLVLSGGKGKKLTEYDASDIMGTGGDWKRDWTRIKERFAFAWVPGFEEDREEQEVFLGIEAISLLNAVQDLNKNDADDEDDDEDAVNPLVTPTPFKLVYDKNKEMSDKYQAYSGAKKLGEEPDEETQEILDKDLKKDYKIDLEKIVSPNKPEEILDMLEACWACSDIEFDEFREFYEEWKDEVPDDYLEEEDEEEDEEEKPKKAKKKKGKKKGKKKSKKKSKKDEEEEEEDEEEEEEEDEEEEEEEEDEEEEEEEEEDEEEEEEEEEPAPKKKKKGKGKKAKAKKKTGKSKTKGKTKKKGKKAKGGKRALTKCDECGKKVRPRKDGTCPNCANELDVPY